MSAQRIQAEWDNWKKSPTDTIVFHTTDSDLFQWQATVHGEKGTPYEGGIFNFNISFPPNYPFNPPKVSSLTRVYHPSFNMLGSICLAELRDQWSPALTILLLFERIFYIMKNPRLDSHTGMPDSADFFVLAPRIAEQWRSDRAAFDRTAKEWTQQFAQIPAVATLTGDMKNAVDNANEERYQSSKKHIKHVIEMQKILELFKLWDTDDNGIIDVKEFTQIMRKLSQKITEAQALRMFKEVDSTMGSDGENGKVYFEELINWMMDVTATSGGYRKEGQSLAVNIR